MSLAIFISWNSGSLSGSEEITDSVGFHIRIHSDNSMTVNCRTLLRLAKFNLSILILSTELGRRGYFFWLAF